MMPTTDAAGQPQRTIVTRFVLPALSRHSTYIISVAVILLLDVITGRYIQFPISFVVPVTFAAWFRSLRYGLALAVLLPVGRFGIATWLEVPSPVPYIAMNAVIRVSILAFIAYLVSRTARQACELAKEVHLLEGLLPICSWCKKIRNERDTWEQIEAYISHRTEATFTHGICPECRQKHFGKDLGE